MKDVEKTNRRKIYFGMDGVLADIQSGVKALKSEALHQYERRAYIDINLFTLMKPTKGAKRVVKELDRYYDLYVLTTAPWNNSSAWDKRLKWIQDNFGGKSTENPFFKKVIMADRKDLVFSPGSYLIDDRYVIGNGAGKFIGHKIWLRLPGNDRVYCAKEYENDVVECRSWYDVLHKLITLNQEDDSWTDFEDEVSDSSN